MDYQRAKDIRGKSLSSLITDNIVSGGGIGSSISQALSEKSKARMTGLKEKFDPLNIAKTLTGGSRLAPAILGRLMGRNLDTINYFAGDPKKNKNLSSEGIDSYAINFATETLGSIYTLMLKMERERVRDEQDRLLNDDFLEDEEDRRNKELIKALTARTKPKAKPKKDSKDKQLEEKGKKQQQKQDKTDRKKETEVKKRVEQAKETAQKVEKKAPSVPTEKVGVSPIITGAVGITAAVIGQEALASNIAKYESGKAGYNAYNKGTIGNKMIPSDKPIDFSKMTITQYLKRSDLDKKDPKRLFAVGKYQIIPDTMKSLVKQLKLDPDKTYLDPQTQEFLFTNGLIGIKRKKVDDYIKGRSNDRDGAILQLAQEFASIGIPYDMKVGNKQLKKGDSYYSGKGGNKAHNPPEAVGAALDLDRQKNLKGLQNEYSNTVGTKIDTASIENKTLKKQTETPPATVVVNNNTSSQTKMLASNKTVYGDDRSAYQKKVQ